jgi:hypothetical protein
MALPLRCRCGHVRGVTREVAPYSAFRFVCYCEDCQAFARFLERPDVLDDAGGTHIFHMPAACVTLTAGADAVRCTSFSAKVLRWYTDCCRTPIANTAVSPRFPVVGLTTKLAAMRESRCSARLSAVSMNAPPSPRCRRTRRLRQRSDSSLAAQQEFSAGGCVGSAGQTRSSTIPPTRRSQSRAYSRGASAVPLERDAPGMSSLRGKSLPGQGTTGAGECFAAGRCGRGSVFPVRGIV